MQEDRKPHTEAVLVCLVQVHVYWGTGRRGLSLSFCPHPFPFLPANHAPPISSSQALSVRSCSSPQPRPFAPHPLSLPPPPHLLPLRHHNPTSHPQARKVLDHNSIVTEVTLQLAPRFMAHSAVRRRMRGAGG